jgi:hypothetical protein
MKFRAIPAKIPRKFMNFLSTKGDIGKRTDKPATNIELSEQS